MTLRDIMEALQIVAERHTALTEHSGKYRFGPPLIEF